MLPALHALSRPALHAPDRVPAPTTGAGGEDVALRDLQADALSLIVAAVSLEERARLLVQAVAGRNWSMAFQLLARSDPADRAALVAGVALQGRAQMLRTAAKEGDVGMIKDLLDASRADRAALANTKVHMRNYADPEPVLHWAASRGHVVLVRLLIDVGAIVDARSKYGGTALMLAAAMGHAEVVAALIDARANVDVPGNNGTTALMVAVARGDVEVVKRLLAAGANPDAQNTNGFTVLMVAAEHGHAKVVKRLLAAGANADAQDKYGDTALDLAAENNHADVVNLLRAVGAPEE